MNTPVDRKNVLLRAAYDILKRSDDSSYVQTALELMAFYDDADCDGSCLMDDIRHELELPEGTDPIPLSGEP